MLCCGVLRVVHSECVRVHSVLSRVACVPVAQCIVRRKDNRRWCDGRMFLRDESRKVLSQDNRSLRSSNLVRVRHLCPCLEHPQPPPSFPQVTTPAKFLRACAVVSYCTCTQPCSDHVVLGCGARRWVLQSSRLGSVEDQSRQVPEVKGSESISTVWYHQVSACCSLVGF